MKRTEEVRTYFQVVVKDQTGMVVRKTRKLRSRSYVLAHVDTAYACLSFGAGLTVPDTGNTGRNCTNNSYSMVAAINIDTYGLVVGGTNTSVAIAEYKLVAQILNAVLTHQVQTFTAPSTAGSTRSWIAQRVFVNNSGGDVVIKECGAYAKHSANAWYFCFVRDIIADPGITISNGGSATLTYTFGVTV